MRFPDDVPVLTDGVVTLRAHRASDVPGIHEQCQDPLSRQWTTVPVPYSMADAEHFAGGIVPAGWLDDSEWTFAVEAADDSGEPRFAGTISLRNEGADRAEIAYGSHPWVRGRGLMLRALHLLLDWGFEERGLRTVIWWANQGNWASRKVAWRLGFSFDGALRQWLPKRGELVDAWVGVLHAGAPRAPRHPWYDAPRIQGSRLGLRRHEDRDLSRVQEAGADPYTQEQLQHFDAPFTAESARGYLESRAERAASGEALCWTAADPVTDDALAFLSLFHIRPGHEAEVGYFTHPDARGKGITTEAVELVCRHAFVPEEDGGLGLSAVRLITTEANAGSRGVAEAAGFTLVGRERRGTRMRDGSFVDAVHYDLLAEEYAGPAGQ